MPELRALTPRNETYPNLSPDGRSLLYAAGQGFPLNLFVMDLESRAVRQLTDNEFEDSAASWSPDGASIVFQREDLQGMRDIWEISFPDGIERNLTDSPQHSEQHPRYAPGGGAILYDSNRDGEGDDNFEIYLHEPDGHGPVRLTEHERWDMYPSMSPDGESIAWRRSLPVEDPDSQNFEIFVKDLASGTESNISRDPGVDTNPHWSPSGNLIVFASNRSGSFELYTIRPDGSSLRKITNGGGPAVQFSRPSFSADGRFVLANRFIRGVADMVEIDLGEEDR